MASNPLESDYIEALTYRITDALTADLALNGIDKKWVRGLVESNVKPQVATILQEVQHRLYQDIIANAMDLARQLSPDTKRGE